VPAQFGEVNSPNSAQAARQVSMRRNNQYLHRDDLQVLPSITRRRARERMKYEIEVTAQLRRAIAAVACTTTWEQFPHQWRARPAGDQDLLPPGRPGRAGVSRQKWDA